MYCRWLAYRSNWGKLDVAVNVGLFVALIWEFRLYIEGNKMLEGVAFEHYGVKLEHVVPSIFSSEFDLRCGVHPCSCSSGHVSSVWFRTFFTPLTAAQ